MSAGHRFEDHTAEVELTVQADTLPELFAQAARALAELLLGGPPPPADTAVVMVTVRAPDLTALFVDWLNELIYRTETEAAVFGEAHVSRVDEREIVAELRGVSGPLLATEVKAATLHDAYVWARGSGFIGHAILDV
jgi:SHS2 domain-containing protein